MARLNDMVHRIVRTEFASGIVDDPPRSRVVDVFRGAGRWPSAWPRSGVVLLKNANGQLPLNAAAVKSIAVIGSHADAGRALGRRFGAGGSSRRQPCRPLRDRPPRAPSRRSYVVWYPSRRSRPFGPKAPRAKVEYNPERSGAAAALAKASDVAIVFVNQPTSEERPLQPDAARQPGPASRRSGRRQPPHHRGAGDRRPRRPCPGSAR